MCLYCQGVGLIV
ncbi:hypothetical protein F383_07834 [Gossypium arboreum]|uniref:Uncharacterized protein n=1 Tax=Gossypium arboreum TaxID=29729 RepID=A0A0B0Q0P7_GOSAR|nr:hypothetical protein F383_17210 [Gossypium arboreum]KHG28388.1 hypothetical protein F383_35287 [Gossypium arboreum]KHG29306.1 hypothetical protein F383_35493 [Gossypium arboreum]KHG30145.1 hypothetical protein F383_07834 [Gossypium arboreum]